MRSTTMILLALFALPIGCATKKPTTTSPEIEYVHVTDAYVVQPGEDILPGCPNTTTNKLWIFTPTGLKAAIKNEEGRALQQAGD